MRKMNCFGLFNIKVYRIMFYCIAMLAFVLAILSKAKHVYSFLIKRKQLTSKKKYCSIIVLNQSGAVLTNSLYLVGLLVADTAQVNIYSWVTSDACGLLHLLFYISLVANMIFKSCLLIFVSLLIIYPFKHPNAWLRWTAIFTLVVWSFYLLLSSICLSDSCLISLSTHQAIRTYIFMKKSVKALNSNSNDRTPLQNIRIVVKLSRPVILEVPFRICLLCLLLTHLIRALPTTFCSYVFLYVLPINIIFSSLYSIYYNQWFVIFKY